MMARYEMPDFTGKKLVIHFTGFMVALCIAILNIGCTPIHSTGIIRNRRDAIEIWRRDCAAGATTRQDSDIEATLRGDEWTVGFHTKSTIVMGIFDAKSGKMKKCFHGSS
jgi:hypothetical protein